MSTASPLSLNCAILTISDTRSAAEDTSGDLLAHSLTEAGHVCARRDLVADNVYQIRRVISDWIADAQIQVILTTGGTGFSHRDTVPEAVRVLFDKEIDGFGEIFRQISFQEIGSSSLQSRALAGYANQTVIFCVPGSNNACRTAWTQLIAPQLDSRQKPCNFATHLSSRSPA